MQVGQEWGVRSEGWFGADDKESLLFGQSD